MMSHTRNGRLFWQILLVLVFISTFFVSSSTVSFADNAVSLKMETTVVQPGSEVYLPIIIERNTGISSLKFLIKYDDTVLTLTNVAFPKNAGTYSSVPQPYTANQIINFVSPLTEFTKTGVFATLTFKVNQNAELNKNCDILIEHNEDDIFDKNFNNMPFVSVNGGVYISDVDQENMAVFPSSLSVVAEESFRNTSFYYVVLPETVAAIEAEAFADCSNLKYIYIPQNTTEIAENAFLNVTDLTVYGKDGSYAEQFAGKMGYTFQAR